MENARLTPMTYACAATRAGEIISEIVPLEELQERLGSPFASSATCATLPGHCDLNRPPSRRFSFRAQLCVQVLDVVDTAAVMRESHAPQPTPAHLSVRPLWEKLPIDFRRPPGEFWLR